MPHVDRDGCALFYECLGDPDAPPVLLVMGLGFSSRAWWNLPRRLSAHYRVIVFDNRGTGRSRPSAERPLRPRRLGPPRLRPAAIRDLAKDAEAVLDAAGILGDVHVFGISMGGLIAQELALSRPRRVRTLALGATFAEFFRGDRASLRTLLELVQVSTRPSPDELENARLLVAPEYLASNPERVRSWLREAGFEGPRVAFEQGLAILRHRGWARLSTLQVPTLVLTGDRDRLVPPANSRILADRIPGARLVVLPGAGHGFPLEREDETVQLLHEHFQRGR